MVLCQGPEGNKAEVNAAIVVHLCFSCMIGKKKINPLALKRVQYRGEVTLLSQLKPLVMIVSPVKLLHPLCQIYGLVHYIGKCYSTGNNKEVDRNVCNIHVKATFTVFVGGVL